MKKENHSTGNKNKSYMLYDTPNNNYPSTAQGILDSGTSGNFITTNSPQHNIQQHFTPLSIKQPAGTGLKSIHKSELNILPQLPQQARESYAFKSLKFPLLSVAKLCDSNCTVVFTKTKAHIIYKKKSIVKHQEITYPNYGQ